MLTDQMREAQCKQFSSKRPCFDCIYQPRCFPAYRKVADAMSDIEQRLRDYAANGCRQWIGIEATFVEAADTIARLRAALEPFVSDYSHTHVFLSSREKMHPAGLELYREDVERARAALEGEG